MSRVFYLFRVVLLLFVLSLYFLICVNVVNIFVVFLFFSHSCSCAGQTLLGCIEFVDVTAFLLMKNVLMHGREKKSKQDDALLPQ